ncbi:hypothetical protein [Virgibacillus halodenitrificans]|nr:hypothetical protein [Virgibacillus halodenitrificans]
MENEINNYIKEIKKELDIEDVEVKIISGEEAREKIFSLYFANTI